ncbi:MAG: anaerobic ribonucleoside-triphosphate reductase activating protein [Bacteriovoracaceae bacterium]|nr:anaerobic ribonucleoside-triphosphate reductase activating protein [Bacteriovoracaceae bacterium]
MYIGGFLKNTLVDFPGNVASTIFISGCNFHCGFCHNPDMVGICDESIDRKKIFEYLKKASEKNFLDGVCITGGEPTLFPRELNSLISELKDLGLLVKLDTNGSNPNVLKELEVDYIAMDLKTSLERYGELSEVPHISTNIKESIDFLKSSKIIHEFRTTLVPGLVEESELALLGELLNKDSRWFFQNFRNDVVYDPYYLGVIPHSKARVDELVKTAAKYCRAKMR